MTDVPEPLTREGFLALRESYVQKSLMPTIIAEINNRLQKATDGFTHWLEISLTNLGEVTGIKISKTLTQIILDTYKKSWGDHVELVSSNTVLKFTFVDEEKQP